MTCVASPMVVAFSDYHNHSIVPAPDTVHTCSTVSANPFSGLRFAKPFRMGKRKTYDYDSGNDDSTSRESVDYTDQGWTARGGNEWSRLSSAFGLAASSSFTGSRNRRRRGKVTTGKRITPSSSTESEGEKSDRMKELLDIVLWNAGEEEIDVTEELEEDYGSDDETMQYIMRQEALKREETIRPRCTVASTTVTSKVNMNKENVADVKCAVPSVSSLRFDSLLKIGSTAESMTKSIMRVEQRTSTMERAFKGVLEESYISKVETTDRPPTSKVTSSSVGDEDDFWGDVEF